MRSKRIAAAFCLCACLALAACANVVLPVSEPEESSEMPIISTATSSEATEEPSVGESLPQTTEFHGDTLTVVTTGSEAFLSDENTPGSIRNGMEERNELLRSRYQIEVAVKAIPENRIEAELKTAEQTGLSVGDILCYGAETSAMLKEFGLLSDIMQLPNFSLTQTEDLANASMLKTGSTLYLLPDISTQTYDKAYVVYYDRALIAEAGLTSPEELVTKGFWTMNTLRQYSEKVSTLSASTSGFALRDSGKEVPYLFWIAEDQPLFKMNDKGYVGFAFKTKDLPNEFTPVRSLLDSYGCSSLSGDDARVAFVEGKLGFYVDRLAYTRELYEYATRDYGILPMPKKDEKQKQYVSPVGLDGTVFSVPVTVSSPGRSGLGLSAFLATGRSVLHPTVLDTFITLYSTDNQQAIMMRYILQNLRFDFGWVYGTWNDQTKNMGIDLIYNSYKGIKNIAATIDEYGYDFDEYAKKAYA